MEFLNPNIALYGEATQSSNFHHSDQFGDPDVANYAIDGVFDTDIRGSSARCAVKQMEQNAAWWQVDLKAEYEVYKVALTTRKRRK